MWSLVTTSFLITYTNEDLTAAVVNFVVVVVNFIFVVVNYFLYSFFFLFLLATLVLICLLTNKS